MKIIVLFKTHLDIGFTDLSARIIRKYNEIYIPQAISVAEEIARSGRKEGFVWTVGSWLVAQYLETADQPARERMIEAIRNNWVSWHGLPFTMHSEVATAELFEYGLSISRELDARFGRKTTGAKYTDVPGHTAAIIPHLAENGIRFLHIGINPASACVDVPTVFKWQFGDKSVNVMYNGDYGEFTRIPGTDTYVYFAHTGDNHGPQSAAVVQQVYDEIYLKYPEATVVAGTLNDVAEEISKIEDCLPVVNGEMGDTWIHGVGTDPQKLSQFKALLRYCNGLGEEERRAAFRHLIMVPEHTWGVNEQIYLKENRNYIRPQFERARNKFNFKIMELSWAEQRKYVLDAAKCLADRGAAEALLNEYYAEAFDPAGFMPVSGNDVQVKGLRLSFTRAGAISALSYGRLQLENCELFGYSYDEYAYDDVWAFENQYLRKRFIDDFLKSGELNWGIEDFGKYGLQDERNEHTASAPVGYELYTDADSVYVLYRLDQNVHAKYGLPQTCQLRITPDGSRVLFDFAWLNKPANRAPEAMWLSFKPGKRLTGISKLGYVVDPATVLPKGGRGLHATDGKVYFDGVTVELLDSALVSVDGKNVYHFRTDEPDMENGVYFNLFNNQWGTNFPMWNEGDGRVRFVLTDENPGT